MKQEIMKYAAGLQANKMILNWLEKNVTGKEDQGEIEHIIDFLIAKDFANLNWASIPLLKEKSKKWIKILLFFLF